MAKVSKLKGKSRWLRKESAAALRAARKLAGFKSASAAAERFGFSDAAYRSHEAGVRAMSTEDIQRYAAAFQVPAKTIAEPDGKNIQMALVQIGTKEAKTSQEAMKARKSAGTRLKIARVARGYDSGRRAATAFKLAAQTYLGHESGKSRFSEEVAGLYSTLLGVRKDWLTDGTLPSGLGPDFDARLAYGLKPEDVHHYHQLVIPHSQPEASEVAQLKAALRTDTQPKWTEEHIDIIPEIDGRELHKRGFQAVRAKPTRFWPFPKGFLRSANYTLKPLIVVVCDKPLGLAQAGDRLVVDTSLSSPGSQGDFLGLTRAGLVRSNSSESWRRQSDMVFIGRIVATLAFSR